MLALEWGLPGNGENPRWWKGSLVNFEKYFGSFREGFRIRSGYSMGSFDFLTHRHVIGNNFISQLSDNSSGFKQLSGYDLEPEVNL